MADRPCASGLIHQAVTVTVGVAVIINLDVMRPQPRRPVSRNSQEGSVLMSETGSLPEKRPDRIVIPLTQGAHRNHYIKLGQYTTFFPKNSIGGSNKKSLAPKLFMLHFEGFPEPVETDIDGGRKRLRCRGGAMRKFLDRYDFRENDNIVIVKRSEYEYDVVRYDAAAASGPPVVPGESGAGPRRGLLRPFTPGADADYITHVLGASYRRGRTHETLVNDFADWLAARGLTVASNAAIDLGLDQPPVIIEAKVIRAARWAQAVREAVGQLYEYRYFQVVAPDSCLLFLASAEIPRIWLDYLDKDREIGAAWRSIGGFQLSDRALMTLGLGDL